jgi:hypothetical protein
MFPLEGLGKLKNSVTSKALKMTWKELGMAQFEVLSQVLDGQDWTKL